MTRALPILALPLAALLALAAAGAVLAQDAQDQQPQSDWMVHVDGAGDTLRFIPDQITLVPGGTVQLMILGNDHGRYSLTLDDLPEYDAEVDTGGEGIVHVAQFAAPMQPGEYPFHDKHHPSAKGLLVVRAASAQGEAPAASASEEMPVVGVGNGYNTKFYPDRLEVRAGEELVFRNNASEIIHTMTAEDGSFDADAVRAGEERVLTAPLEPGEYPFVCKYHVDSGMRGTLVVLPAEEGTTAQPAAEDDAPAESAEEERRGVPGPAAAGALVLLALVALLARRR